MDEIERRPFDPAEFGFACHGTTADGAGWTRGEWTIVFPTLDGAPTKYCEIGRYENGEFVTKYFAEVPRDQDFARRLFEHLGFMKIDLKALSQ